MKRIGILRGGTGHHYKDSLKKGGDIIFYISENLADKYKPVDILIDEKNVWHMNGVPILPADLMHKIDVAWNTVHPSVSVILENLSIPHVGGNSFPHALENSRDMLRKHMAQIGVSMPRSILLPKSAREILEKFPAPWKVGDKLAGTFPELAELIENNKNILVEEFIAGRVLSMHSILGFRGEDIYIFPPVNIFGNFTPSEKEKLISLAKNLHRHLGAKHYLKLNFILDKRGRFYLLDFETAPNLKSFSHFSQACESAGAKMHQVVEHMLESA